MRRRRRAKLSTSLDEWYRDQGEPWHRLATRAGVSLRTVYRVASGERCSYRVAEALHKATGVPIVALVKGKTT